jgi:hypothetical protein
MDFAFNINAYDLIQTCRRNALYVGQKYFCRQYICRYICKVDRRDRLGCPSVWVGKFWLCAVIHRRLSEYLS